MAGNEVPFLRSLDNSQISFVRFINCTTRTVALYWIDYQGQAISYGTLYPGSYVDIDTFVTHPWIFVDDETKERFLVNQRDVFFPEPWLEKYLNARRQYLPHRIDRTNAKIMIPMYSLLELSLRAIQNSLKYKEQVFKLNIPRCLQYEIASRLPKLQSEQRVSRVTEKDKKRKYKYEGKKKKKKMQKAFFIWLFTNTSEIKLKKINPIPSMSSNVVQRFRKM
ncbi:von Hippel-Lindau tumor suppressor [Vespula squamosa]|uniref:von Hippel-Lindau tumor suppressor n=1 Tax=Vespula squamosa TaxID=30214 RepID=A0ABD2C5J5_VESSQ